MTVATFCQKQSRQTIEVMNLKNQLRDLLEERDITASQLSRQTGVPKQTISNWLGGERPRDIGQVKKVADFLGTTVDHLCFGSGSPEHSQSSQSLGALFGDEWLAGKFEIRLRRIKD